MKNLYPLLLSVIFTLNLSAQEFYFNILEPFSIFDSYDSSVFTHTGPDELWGWDGILTQEIIGELVYAEEVDQLHVFCEANTIDYTGKIVLIDRGECHFSEKALFAQEQGAFAVVIANNQEGPAIIMGAGIAGAEVTIPVIMLPKQVADPIIAVLDNGPEVIASFSYTPNASTFITGHMIADDGDCLPDPEHLSLAGYSVNIQGDQLSKTVVANAQGFYSAAVFPGNYDISLTPDLALWTPCPTQNITIAEQEVLEVDLPATAEVECPYLTVDISNGLLRRCFDNNVFYINYCNAGSATAEDAYIQILLPELITIVTATAAYAEVGDNLYEFSLGDLGIGQCGTINLTVELSCDAILGQTLCATAEIFPHDPCIGTSAWDGVDVRAEANCAGPDVLLNLRNQGTTDMPESKMYRVISDNQVIKIGDFQLAAGESLSLPFWASGPTYRIETDPIPFSPVAAIPSAAIELCTSGSYDPVAVELGYINQYAPANYGDYYDEICIEVIGSFDPNDKQAHITGYGPEHYIDQNVPLEYKIRFQNTGTDTAFTVRILDTLSQWLDPASIRPLQASHVYDFSITENIVEIDFPNILLPDSTVNEPGSNGFIIFRINQKVDVQLESVINNSAAIYFDYNEPVITNTVMHTIGKDFIPLVLATENLQANADVDVFPNPTSNELTIQLKAQYLLNSDFLLFNNLGELVYSIPLNTLSATMQINELATGAYYYTIQQENEQVALGKLIKIE